MGRNVPHRDDHVLIPSGGVKRPSSRTVWGADPGQHGAVCAVRFSGDEIIRVRFVSPEVEYSRAKISGRKKGRIKVLPFLESCKALSLEMPPDEIVLERVGAHPGQGVNAVFSFGHSAGIFESILIASSGKSDLIMLWPKDWKAALGLSDSNLNKPQKKRLCVRVANEYLEEHLGKKAPKLRLKDDGKAEAFLLACTTNSKCVEEIRAISKEKRTSI